MGNSEDRNLLSAIIDFVYEPVIHQADSKLIHALGQYSCFNRPWIGRQRSDHSEHATTLHFGVDGLVFLNHV